MNLECLPPGSTWKVIGSYERRPRPKVLNLYAGLGGNRKHWAAEVTAIEFDPKIAAVYQRLYPNDTVIVADAHVYLAEHYQEFDFVWSSPPCQRHSKMNRATRHKSSVRYIDGTLYEEIIFLQTYCKAPWVVENVVPYYQPMCNPTRIGRHLFWSNFYIPQFDEPKQPKGFINMANVAGKKALQEWLGIHYDENIYYGSNHCPAQVLRNCVHPLTGEHVFNAGLTARPGTKQRRWKIQ